MTPPDIRPPDDKPSVVPPDPESPAGIARRKRQEEMLCKVGGDQAVRAWRQEQKPDAHGDGNQAAASPGLASDNAQVSNPRTPPVSTTKRSGSGRRAARPAAPVMNEDDEEAVLAVGLQFSKALAKIVEEMDSGRLSGADFFKPTQGKLLEHMRALHAAGRAFDARTLADALEDEGQAGLLKDLGGRPFLHTLNSMTVIPALVGDYIEGVRKAALERRRQKVLDRIQDVTSNGSPPAEALAEIERLIAGEAGAEAEPEVYRLEPLDWQTLLRDGVPEVEYISEPYLPKGARIWIWGATGTVKSLWCACQAAKLSREGVRVSYFSEENPLQEDLRRLARLQPDPSYFRMFHRTGMDLVDPTWVAALLEATKGDAICFLDSWTDLWSGDEKENREVQQFDAKVLKPLQAQNVTPVLIHHTGHRQPFSDRAGATAGRGASAQGQKADVVLEFKDAGDGRFVIVYGKCRLGGIQQPLRCFQVQDSEDGRVEIVDAAPPEELAAEQLAEKMVQAILTSSKGMLTTTELKTTVRGSHKLHPAALDLLADDSRVRCSVEKARGADGKLRDAKVWRPADVGLDLLEAGGRDD